MRRQPRLRDTTARAVALSRVSVARPGDGVVEAELCKRLRSWRDPVLKAIWPAGMDWRTAFFDQVVLEGVGAAAPQVVLVGAGYDDRAFRFRTDGVRFFEIDRPEIQTRKTGHLVDAGADCSSVRFVGCNLGKDDVVTSLLRAGFDADARTLFICEGLLFYLKEEDALRLLAAITSLAHPGSKLALTTRGPRKGNRLGSLVLQAQRLALQLVGEAGGTVYSANRIRSLLNSLMWTIERDASREVNQRDSRLILARRDTNPHACSLSATTATTDAHQAQEERPR